MRNSQIITAINNISEILNSNVEYPREVSYAITKNMITLQDLYRPYDEERIKIVEKYAGKKGDTILEENKPSYEKELKELLDIDVEFSPHKVSIDKFPENISPTILYMLDFMIDE